MLYPKNRNNGKIIKLEENGKYNTPFGLKFNIIGFEKDSVILDVTDTDKYFYEKGHKYTVKRKINFKTKNFRFNNKNFNIENVNGAKEFFEEK